MSRLASLVGAFALTCSFAAVAQTPVQVIDDGGLRSSQSAIVPDTSVPAGPADVTNCGPRDQIVSQLGAMFKEAPSGIGMIDPTAVVEVFVSDAGTFTILASGTDGTSCILASGEGWDGAIPVSGRGA